MDPVRRTNEPNRKCLTTHLAMCVWRTAVRSHGKHLLLLISVISCLAYTAHSFFFMSSLRRPSNIDLRCHRTGEVRDVVYRALRSSRIATSLWAAPDKTGLDGTSGDRGSGEATDRGREGRDKIKGAKGSTKRVALISGPPRLECVPEEELDTIHVFREERPGRSVDAYVPAYLSIRTLILAAQ